MLHLNVPNRAALNAQSTLPTAVPPDISVSVQWISGLPISADYTPLEYVDISKQFTHDSTITTNALDVELDVEFVNPQQNWALYPIVTTPDERLYYYFHGSSTYPGLFLLNDRLNSFFAGQGAINKLNVLYRNKIPNPNNKRMFYHIHDFGYTVDDKFYEFLPTDLQDNVNWGKMLVGNPVTQYGQYCRLWRMTVRQNGVMTTDLVPCTRVSDGIVGLWCNVYNKFYQT